MGGGGVVHPSTPHLGPDSSSQWQGLQSKEGICLLQRAERGCMLQLRPDLRWTWPQGHKCGGGGGGAMLLQVCTIKNLADSVPLKVLILHYHQTRLCFTFPRAGIKQPKGGRWIRRTWNACLAQCVDSGETSNHTSWAVEEITKHYVECMFNLSHQNPHIISWEIDEKCPKCKLSCDVKKIDYRKNPGSSDTNTTSKAEVTKDKQHLAAIVSPALTSTVLPPATLHFTAPFTFPI